VAVFLVDQRMPRLSGVEFLEKAIELYPEAKRGEIEFESRRGETRFKVRLPINRKP